jgi:hypothetical protein
MKLPMPTFGQLLTGCLNKIESSLWYATAVFSQNCRAPGLRRLRQDSNGISKNCCRKLSFITEQKERNNMSWKARKRQQPAVQDLNHY